MNEPKPYLHRVPKNELELSAVLLRYKDGRPLRLDSMPLHEQVAFVAPDEKDEVRADVGNNVVAFQAITDKRLQDQLAEVLGDAMYENTTSRRGRIVVDLNGEAVSCTAVERIQHEKQGGELIPVSAVYKMWLRDDPAFENYFSFELDPKREPTLLMEGPSLSAQREEGDALTGANDDAERLAFFSLAPAFAQSKAQKFGRTFIHDADIEHTPAEYLEILEATGKYAEVDVEDEESGERHAVLRGAYQPLRSV